MLLDSLIELCKPFFEKAVKVSNEWDNTAYIYKEDSGKILVLPWNKWKYTDPKIDPICTIDGNSICFYYAGRELAVITSDTKMYRELLKDYIK